MDIVVRAASIGWVLFVGVHVFRKWRGGQVRVANISAPHTLIERRTQPVRYWVVVLFSYAILAGMIALAILAP